LLSVREINLGAKRGLWWFESLWLHPIGLTSTTDIN